MPKEFKRSFEFKFRPPYDWRDRLKAIASDYDLELGTIIEIGDKATCYIHAPLPLPGAPSSPPETRLQAFEEAAWKMLEDPKLARIPQPRVRREEIFRSNGWIAVGLCLFASGVISLRLKAQLAVPEPLGVSLIVFSLFSIFRLNFIAEILSKSSIGISGDLLQVALRQQEELFNRLSAAHSSPEENAEFAKTTLIFRANSAKDDQDRIWRRSNLAFYLGCLFFFLSLAGPASSYWFALKNPAADLFHFLPSISLSVIMLTAAASLLRYDGKLREHFQAKADEVAYLNRLQLAVDSAHSVSNKTYRTTLRNIITQLVTPPPTLVSSNRPLTEEPQTLPQDALIQTASNLINAAMSRIPTAPGAPQNHTQASKPGA